MVKHLAMPTNARQDEDMEHQINIGETDIVLTAISEAPQKLSQVINKKLHHLPPPTLEPCIFKVHDGLRRSNPDAYTPMIVSIGPYHYRNPSLSAMEEHKLRYLRSFLERKEEKSVEMYILALEKLEARARECYAGRVNLETDEFLELMLLDGCFIVEFVRKFSEIGPDDEDDPIFCVDWMRVQICRDLMLLENQLPYFILSELYEMAEDPMHKEPFMNRLVFAFSSMFPKLCPVSVFSSANESNEIKHLLHSVHIICRPPSDKTSLEGNTICVGEVLDQMHSVTELQEAGVRFKKVGKVCADVELLDLDSMSDSVSLFDIKFNKGLMEIPSFKVDDSTETFLRNLIAFEQHYSHVNPKYFTDYTTFMDQLINTEKDVNLLRLKGIIMNLLGDDDKVACIFNKLGEGVVTSPSFFYAGVCKKVNQHYNKIWNVMMAKLRHDYFNSPWATVSTIAAVVLLILTIIQTIASVMPLLD